MTTTTTHRSAAGGWISAASAARETEALTRALAISISGAGGGGGWEGSALATSSLASSSSLSATATPTSSDAAAAVSPFLVFDHGAARAGMAVQETRIKKKRRSRAKQVDRTVYITTDPANFRRMVQQVTGIQVGPPVAGIALMPPEPRIAPELPTLDTSSAFAMERAGLVCGSFEPGLMEGGAGFGLEAPPTMAPSCHYPTLESWSVM